MLKQVVEAQSSESMAEALALAMSEASVFVTEAHDIRVSLLNLNSSRDGDYQATLEITLIPFGGIETPTQSADYAEPVRRAETLDRERKAYDAASIKARVIDQVRQRNSNVIPTAAMDRPQLTEIDLVSQLAKENDPQDTAVHERVDDGVHVIPIGELAGREFSHVSDPAKEEVVVKRLPLKKVPLIVPAGHTEEP